MNCYRLAAHFASRSCDGLVKRFGLSSSCFSSSNLSRHPPLALLLFLHQRDADAASSRDVLFFHRTRARVSTPSRGGSKASHRGSRSLGISETKDESRGCVLARVTTGKWKRGGGRGESGSDGGSYKVLHERSVKHVRRKL